MSEKDNLPQADGTQEPIEVKTEQVNSKEAIEDAASDGVIESIDLVETEVNSPEESSVDIAKSKKLDEPTQEVSEIETAEAPKANNVTEVATNEVAIEEIEASNAEDAEDEDNSERHELTEKDYHAMSMEELVNELEVLVSNQKIQVIRDHVDTIKSEFNTKFSTLLDEKKEEFLAEGGNIIDFRYSFLSYPL